MKNEQQTMNNKQRKGATRAFLFHCSLFVVRCSFFIALAFLSPKLRAQDADVDLPAVTPPNFSQVAGKFRIISSAAPTEIEVEKPITLKVQIVGQGPKAYQPKREYLHIFPEGLAADFHLEAVPAEDKFMPEKGLWEFVYRLRPKNTGVDKIPSLRLLYFAPGSNKFQSSFAEEIPIKVRPALEAAKDLPPLKVVPAPPGFYELAPVEEVLRDARPWFRAEPGLVLAFLAVPPALCLVWYRLGRRWHPTTAERRRLARSKAARLALSYLEKQAPDAIRTRAVLTDFLRQRLDLSAQEPTPAEVARHLKRLGVAKKTVAAWTAIFQTCDQYRFAPDAARRFAPATQPLSLEAIRLIQTLEADPCVTR